MTRIPSPMEVRTLLEQLLGRSVDVRPTSPWAPVSGQLGTVARYVDDSLVVGSVTVADLRFSAYAGAAIGLLTPSAASDVIDTAVLPRSMRENLDEVLNVCAALLNAEGAPHMRLYHVQHIGAPDRQDIQALCAVLGRRLDLAVTISGYGAGRLSFVGIA